MIPDSPRGKLSEAEVKRGEAKRLFARISQLAPHTSDRTVIYNSATLPHLLQERTNSRKYDGMPPVFASWLNEMRNEDVTCVHFPKPQNNNTQSLLLGNLNADNKKKAVVNFDSHTFQLQQVTSEAYSIIFVPDNNRWGTPPFVKDQQFLISLFQNLRDDLLAGRQNWAESVRDARISYVAELMANAGKEAPFAVQSFIHQMVRALPDNRFSLYGIPTGERTEQGAPRFSLYTTLPVTEEVASAIDNQDPISREISNRSSYKRENFNSPTGRYTYDNSPHNVIRLETFSPAYYHLGSTPPRNTDRRALFDRRMEASEIDFANFMAGSQTHDYGLRINGVPATLLWKQPNSGVAGRVFDRELITIEEAYT